MGVNNADWLHNVNEWMEKLNPDVKFLNESLSETDMTNWINIGIIKNGSNIGTGGDAYLMVNPNFPQTDDFSTFRYRASGYNTKPDGTGDRVLLDMGYSGGEFCMVDRSPRQTLFFRMKLSLAGKILQYYATIPPNNFMPISSRRQKILEFLE